MNRIGILEAAITVLDTAYEVADPCILPDDIGKALGTVANATWKFKSGSIVPNLVYDAMRLELKALCPDSYIFSTPTASELVSTEKKIKHDPPLTSIAKLCHENRSEQEQMLFKWLYECLEAAPDDVKHGKMYDLDEKTIEDPETKVKTHHGKRTYNGKVVLYPRDYFYQQFKLDGAALALYYKSGTLIAAGTRPRNGVDGEDVTEQVKYVQRIPQQLPIPFSGTVRGELICLKSDFEKVQKARAASGEELRKNPRNHAAGGIRNFKDPSKVKDQLLTFIAYEVITDNPPFRTEIEKSKFASKELGFSFVRTVPFNFYDLEKMETIASTLDYEVDGVVLGVNSIDNREQMGRIGDANVGDPQGKRAWKFAEEKAIPKIKAIEWNPGRTGTIVPVSIFDGVQLAGTTVCRATLHNLGFMIRNQISVGTEVVVIKSGKIIPKVIGVHANPLPPTYPDTCPSCGHNTIVEHTPATGSAEEMFRLVCPNAACPAKLMNSLEHYLATFGVLGLGESRIAALVKGGKVKTPVDFYKLSVKDAIDCGLSERQALLAIASIHMIAKPDKYEDEDLYKAIKKAQSVKKVIPLWQLFASFGIESAGKQAGKLLVDHFGSFDAIRSASANDMVIHNIGEKTADVIYDFLSKNKKMIDELMSFVEPELPKVGPLTGRKYVLTGGFPGGKKEIEKKIEALGGKTSGSVSKTTDFVVEGTDAGEKAIVAKKLGIPIITLEVLEKDHLK